MGRGHPPLDGRSTVGGRCAALGSGDLRCVLFALADDLEAFPSDGRGARSVATEDEEDEDEDEDED